MQRFENTFFIQIKELRSAKIDIINYFSHPNSPLKFHAIMASIEQEYHIQMEKLMKESADEFNEEKQKKIFMLSMKK